MMESLNVYLGAYLEIVAKPIMTQIDEWICPNCGLNRDFGVFCGNCGTKKVLSVKKREQAATLNDLLDLTGLGRGLRQASELGNIIAIDYSMSEDTPGGNVDVSGEDSVEITDKLKGDFVSNFRKRYDATIESLKQNAPSVELKFGIVIYER